MRSGILTRFMENRVGRGRIPRPVPEFDANDAPFMHEFSENELTADELDLSLEPCESEFGEEAYAEIVFDDCAYDSLCMAIHGQRLWDSAEEEEVE